MKRSFLLLFAAIAIPALAEEAPLTFRERMLLAQAAEENESFHPFPSMMARQAGPHIARTMRRCWNAAARQGAKPFVLVADIDPDGYPRAVEVKPAHGAARCFAAGFASRRYLVPPAYPGRDGFPVMMRIGGAS